MSSCDVPDAEQLICALLVGLFELAAEDIEPHRHLETLGLDSLDRAELALAVEELIDRRIDDDDIAPLRTVGDVTALVALRRHAPV